MCGIVGFSSGGTGWFPEAGLVAAVHCLTHRGPDASNQWSDIHNGIALGHTRLKILDLSDNANQPFSDETGIFRIVFNGEIYNWQTLRQGLERRGHLFRTEADTEVILALYKEHGPGLTRLLKGMYAFAIYDASQKLLFCARDPLGKKPFVYSENEHGFFFSSEIPSLLSLLPERPAIRMNGIASMLLHNLRHIPDPETAWESVYKLRPGHSMLVKDGKVQRQWRHWNPGLLSNVTVAGVRESFVQSVETRMRADVPVGLLLSGGVDSSAIAAIMVSSSQQPVRTYVLGRDSNDEDVRRARIVAEALGTEHRELFFHTDQIWEQYAGMIAAYGEPFALLPLVYTQQLCSLMKADGVGVALCGHGADEVFNGYDGQWLRAQISRLLPLMPESIKKRFFAKGKRSALLATQGVRRATLYRDESANIWNELIEPEIVRNLQCTVADELLMLGRIAYSRYYCDEANFAALLLENQHSLALAADFPAMQAGVELRAPFMDAGLVEEVFSLPLNVRVPFFPARPKYFLKRLVQSFVPPAVLHLPKRGFGYGMQEADLFRQEWRTRCEEMLFESTAPYFLKARIEFLWREMLAGNNHYAALLSKILSIHIWHESLATAAVSVDRAVTPIHSSN